MAFAPFKKKVLFKEHSMTLYSIGWLAMLVHRHSVTLWGYDRDGILPKPIFHGQHDEDNDGFRYYTAAELLGYSEIIKSNRPQPGKKKGAEFSVLKLKLHAFKSALKREMNKDERIICELPGEAAIEQARRNKIKNKDYLQVARKIIKV